MEHVPDRWASEGLTWLLTWPRWTGQHSPKRQKTPLACWWAQDCQSESRAWDQEPKHSVTVQVHRLYHRAVLVFPLYAWHAGGKVERKKERKTGSLTSSHETNIRKKKEKKKDPSQYWVGRNGYYRWINAQYLMCSYVLHSEFQYSNICFVFKQIGFILILKYFQWNGFVKYIKFWRFCRLLDYYCKLLFSK